MAYILHVNAQNLLFFFNGLLHKIEKTVMQHNLHYSFNVKKSYAFSVKYTNVPFEIQVFRFIHRKFVKKMMYFS